MFSLKDYYYIFLSHIILLDSIYFLMVNPCDHPFLGGQLFSVQYITVLNIEL